MLALSIAAAACSEGAGQPDGGDDGGADAGDDGGTPDGGAPDGGVAVLWESHATGHPGYFSDVVATGGTAFTAVGSGGAVARSVDGRSWTLSASGAAKALLAVTRSAALGGTLIAAGEEGAIFTSADDGANWRARNFAGGPTLRGLAVGSPTILAVGDQGTVYGSLDAQTFDLRAQGGPYFSAAAFKPGGTYVAVGLGAASAGVAQTSTDLGRNWTTRLTVGRNLADVIWSNSRGLFVAAGAEGKIYTSSDALGWTPRFEGADLDFVRVRECGGKLVAISVRQRVCIPEQQCPPLTRLYASADGIAWQLWTTLSGTAVYGLACSGRTVAVGSAVLSTAAAP